MIYIMAVSRKAIRVLRFLFPWYIVSGQSDVLMVVPIMQ